MGGEERAPCSARTLEPTKASSAVVTPGRTAAAIVRRALATMRPQARSFSSCSCLVMDMGGPSLYYCTAISILRRRRQKQDLKRSAHHRKHCVVRGGGERLQEGVQQLYLRGEPKQNR